MVVVTRSGGPAAAVVDAGSSRVPTERRFRSIELFSGAGGLALGTHLAGFDHEVLVEYDKDACDTLDHNIHDGSVPGVERWRVERGDVRAFDYHPYLGVDLVAGGPPCQPFSIGGNHRGAEDSRNMIPEFARAVRELAPSLFLMENVRGLLRPGFRGYFDYVLLEMARPDNPRRDNEDWVAHMSRLREDAASRTPPMYAVTFQVVNAADHGVPQLRHRVFVVGFRTDMQVHFEFPAPTHSLDRLLYEQWVTGEYWARHAISPPAVPPDFKDRIASLHRCPPPEGMAWRTVRDELAGLPMPTLGSHDRIANHQLQRGARSYTGHTGSLLDMPAKTLKAGDHGVPGGENMLRHADGSVRYFTVREAARIQTYPDSWRFKGAWSEAMRQIGNAVPVKLAQAIATAAAAELANG